jgi:hypothetical protein
MTTSKRHAPNSCTINIVEHSRSGLCPCGGEARPGQGYCLECHKAAQKRYLARKAAKHAADHRAHLALIAGRLKEGDRA